MHSRHVRNAFAHATALFATMVVSMLATPTFAQTAPMLPTEKMWEVLTFAGNFRTIQVRQLTMNESALFARPDSRTRLFRAAGQDV
jgi:hypothetical protein